MLLLVGMAVEGYTKLYLEMGKRAKLIWPKVEKPREVKKERFFVSFQRTPYTSVKKGRNQGNLEHHGLDMVAQHARFIFVREGLVGKSILSFLSV